MTGWRIWLICALLPTLANTVVGKPSPAPPPANDSLLVIPLWQSAASFAGLSNSTQFRQATAYGALADYQDRPHRRVQLHHFDLPCDTCHAPSSARQAAVFEESPSPQLTGDVNRACTSGGCHAYDRSLNHPIGVAVPAPERLPSYMPPDHIDRIDCLTCHSDPRPTKPEDDAGERMIVVPDGDDLCNSCHMQMQGNGRTPAHWRFSNKAHLGSIGLQPPSTTGMDVAFNEIDRESMTCVSCHDEVSVTVPQENETYDQRAARWTTMSDHAIGMRYAAVALQRGELKYPPADAERIRLFDGKVGCGSCHSLYADNPAYLVAQQKNGQLCRKCHIK